MAQCAVLRIIGVGAFRKHGLAIPSKLIRELA